MSMRFYTFIVLFVSGLFNPVTADDQAVLDQKITINAFSGPEAYLYLWDIFSVKGIPVFIESNSAMEEACSSLNGKTVRIEDILKEACRVVKGHRYSIVDGVIFIQQISLAEEPGNPLNKPYPQNIHCDDLSQWEGWDSVNQKAKSQVLVDLLKCGIVATDNMDFTVKSYRRETKGMLTRNVIIDLMSRSTTFAHYKRITFGGASDRESFIEWFGKWLPASVIDGSAEPYQMSIHRYSQLQRGPVLSEEKNVSESGPKPTNALDGRGMVKVDALYFRAADEIVIELSNVSDQELDFGGIRNDLVIGEIYDHPGGGVFGGSELRLIYPGEGAPGLEGFTLAPKDSRKVSVILPDARQRRNPKRFLTEIGAEEKAQVETLPFEPVPAGLKHDALRPLVYFRDSAGALYKSWSFDEATVRP
jgi:hypothetical protein